MDATRREVVKLAAGALAAMAADPGLLIRKAFEFEVKAIDEERRTVEAIVSTEAVDRVGDIIRAAGWDLTAYRKNPVVMWAHDYLSLPIGKALEVGVERVNGAPVLRAVTEFSENDRAEEVFQLYVERTLRAWSVGFRPIKWQAMYEPEQDGGRFLGYEFLEQELLEYSAVPIPANPEALVIGAGLAASTGANRVAFVGAEAFAKGLHFHRGAGADFHSAGQLCYAPPEIASTPPTPATAETGAALADLKRTLERRNLLARVRLALTGR